MKLFGRSPKRLIAALWNLPSHLRASIRCIAVFQKPITLLYCYLTRTNPKSRRVSLRNGIVLHLSQDHLDIVTVYLIFCRRDYGSIKAGTSVVDVGANIGVYSVYAALEGASSVNAYEPCEESFDLLQKNIICNGLEQIITAHKAVVVGRPSPPIMFPRISSVHNRIENDRQEASDNYALVPAIPFSKAAENLRAPNLVKMDCEGGEYDIVLNTESAVFENVEEIRLEYHRGPSRQLFTALETSGYKLFFFEKGENAGIVWCSKRALT